MKKWMFTLALALLMAAGAQAQSDAIKKYFDRYADDEAFTVVHISSKLFELFAKVDPDMDPGVSQVMKDLRGLRILVRESDGMKYYNEVAKMLDFDAYEELMTVRSDSENVRFYIKEGGSHVEELLLLVGAPDNFVLMSFVGKIDLENISKLTQGVDIDVDGIDHLKELEKDDAKGKKRVIIEKEEVIIEKQNR